MHMPLHIRRLQFRNLIGGHQMWSKLEHSPMPLAKLTEVLRPYESIGKKGQDPAQGWFHTSCGDTTAYDLISSCNTKTVLTTTRSSWTVGRKRWGTVARRALAFYYPLQSTAVRTIITPAICVTRSCAHGTTLLGVCGEELSRLIPASSLRHSGSHEAGGNSLLQPNEPLPAWQFVFG